MANKDKDPKVEEKRDPSTTEHENTTSESMLRRDFLRLGVAVALTTPLVGFAACSTPTEPGPSDGGAPESGKPRPKDPQDAVSPEKYDKAKSVQRSPETISLSDTLFPLGVQAGAMEHDGALLWGYASDKKAKTLVVWRKGSNKGENAIVFEKELQPKAGYFHQRVEGLAPGTLYHYAFFQGKAQRSTVGQFRTAWIQDSLKPLTFAATSCTSSRRSPFTALEITAKHDFDVFLQLGDFSYNDGAKTREEYRNKWQPVLKDPGYRAVLSKAGMYLTWDDHEVINNDKFYSISKEHMEIATAAYFENTALDPRKGNTFWTSYRWGKTAEFIVLDCRGERQPSTRHSDDPIYISKKQMAWFKKTLKESPCHFKIILNSVPIIDWSNTTLGTFVMDDRWQGYKKQRTEILEHISSNKLSNIWWISGDLHFGVVAKVDPEGPHSKMYEIMAGPGGNRNILWPIYQKADAEERDKMFPKKQFMHLYGDSAATLVTLDPWKNTVEIKFLHHETGEILYHKTLSQDA